MQILTCPVGPEVVLGKLELLGDSGRHHNKSLVCYVGVIWLSCVKIWYKNSNFLYIGRTAPKSVKDNVVHTVHRRIVALLDIPERLTMPSELFLDYACC